MPPFVFFYFLRYTCLTMPAPSHITRETRKKTPVLIIDKDGVLGLEIARLLHHEFLPVFVSQGHVEKDIRSHVVHIPFKRRPPKIPENRFAHMFFVDSENRYVRSMIPSLVAYAKSTNINLSIVTSIYSKKMKNFDKLCVNPLVKLFVTGDLFSENRFGSPVSEMIAVAHQKKQITLSGQGIDEIYTSSVYAASRAVIELIFSHSVSESPINIYTDYPSSFLSLARNVVLIDPDVRIDFKKSAKKHRRPQWHAKGWQMTLPPINEQIKEAYDKVPLLTDKEAGKQTNSRVLSIPFGPYVAAVGVALFFLLMIPLFCMLAGGFLGRALTYEAMSQLERGSYKQARIVATQASTSFTFANSVTQLFIPLSNTFGRGKTAQTFSQSLETGILIDEILIDMSFAFEEYSLSTTFSDRSLAKEKAVSAFQNLRLAVLTLVEVSSRSSVPQEYQTRLQTYNVLGNYFLSVSDVLPDVLGYDEEKQYLVLFQNNNELRPGGGFIGSYGLLTVDMGKISQFTIHDVYDADGQLSAHVEPPKPLKDYMGVSHWYLRDSNFSPDFVENAARAAYFLKLETGDEVNGVFAIDTTFIEGLLTATGPITVEEYSDTVDALNFSEKTQSQIEDDFFPGSQTKKTFLSAVSDDIYQKLYSGEGIAYDKLLSSVAGSLLSKHLVLAFADESTQLPFTAANLSGTLWDPRESVEGVNDFIGIIESNLGLNKVNPYIERYISQNTSLTSDATIQTTLSIRYKNTSTQTTKFGGTYKNYLQILLPLDSDITEMTINGENRVLLTSEQAAATRQLESAEVRGSIVVDRWEVGEKRSVGFLVDVPVQETVTVEIGIQKQTIYSPDSPVVDYSLLIFKQPGRPNDPYTFTFSYPQTYQLLEKTESLKGSSNDVTAFFLLDSDKEFNIKVGKK